MDKSETDMNLGEKGEIAGAKFLKKNGHKIIETNFSCRHGEIDIIAKKNEITCFVEVKTRSNENYGRPIDAITPFKVKHMVRSAQYYIAKKSLEHQEVRLDIIEVIFHESKPMIRHTENAIVL